MLARKLGLPALASSAWRVAWRRSALSACKGGITLHLAVVPEPGATVVTSNSSSCAVVSHKKWSHVLFNDGGLFVFDQARDDGCGGQTQCLDIRPQSVHVGPSATGRADPVAASATGHRLCSASHQAPASGAHIRCAGFEQLDAGVVLQQVLRLTGMSKRASGRQWPAHRCQLHPVQGVLEPQKTRALSGR